MTTPAPQVVFYLLQRQAPQAREQFVCRLAEKAWRQGYRVYIHAASQAQAQQLDRLLWTYRDDSFLPHDLYPQAADSTAPVLVGHAQATHPPALPTARLLINLAQEVPEGFLRFERVAEVLSQDPLILRAGRDRYRHYSQVGAKPDTHKVP